MHPERTWVLLLMIFVGTTTSLLAVVLLLRSLHEMNHDERLEHVLVSLIAVAGICLLHMFFALHYALTYFSQMQEPRPTLNDEQGGLRFGGVAPLVVLGICLSLVHYRHDDPNGRYHYYLAAHAPAGAI